MNTLARWHDIIKARDPQGLDEILTEDCVFLSPVVHRPQEGRAMTVFYLTGAMNVFNDTFHYTKEVVTDEHAVLEFECTVDGIVINGVDIMTFADDGRIREFRVMVRPLKGVQMIHGKMAAMLDQLKGAAEA